MRGMGFADPVPARRLGERDPHRCIMRHRTTPASKIGLWSVDNPTERAMCRSVRFRRSAGGLGARMVTWLAWSREDPVALVVESCSEVS
jgi:hypothetical protein